MNDHTYRGDFGNGLVCTVTFDKPPVKGHFEVMPIEWSRKPTREELDGGVGARYVKWINGIREELATRWNMTFIAAVNAEKNRTEMWGFKPNQPATLLKVLPCNIGPNI